MGYVGCVTAACLADHGHDVTGVDVDGKKVEMINHSESPIIEPGLTDIIKRGVNAGRLRATTDTTELGSVSLIWLVPGFELLEEDDRWVDIRRLNWPIDSSIWTRET